MSSLALPVAARGLDACGFVRRSLIIWDKGHIVIACSGRRRLPWPSPGNRSPIGEGRKTATRTPSRGAFTHPAK